MKKLITLALFSVAYQFAFAITIYLGLGGAEFFGSNISYPEMNNPEHMNPVLNVINSLIVGVAFYYGYKKFTDETSSNLSGAKFGFFVSIFAIVTTNITNESFNNLYISNSIAAIETLIWVIHFVILGIATAFIFRKVKD